MAEGSVASWLLSRADSYCRDAWVLSEDGDSSSAAIYRTVAAELRKLAGEVPAERIPSLCVLLAEAERELADSTQRPSFPLSRLDLIRRIQTALAS